ncbi:NifQ [Thiorhodovibrio winogradskyi]|uniref:NifQ n=1 Tax=Thiorhodovibrio winogradskyi TaxID=77007 RepID=A0ABZ0SBZ0_9GAMM|nr:nitrogen fixation protein NifQ [Thiorhodovibrio winogradskyi]
MLARGSGVLVRDPWRGQSEQPPGLLAGSPSVQVPKQPTVEVEPLLDSREFFHQLMRHAAGHGNDHAYACMIASRCGGQGALPDWLGLEPAAFGCLMRWHFPGLELGGAVATGARLAADRMDEVADLVRILLMDKAGESPSEVWMAHMVAAGCCGDDHLWQDLGLLDRAELTALMQRNFPALAARNIKDMKWKRFLYKQLCESEGIYSCRAPSCGQCVDYHACFSP